MTRTWVVVPLYNEAAVVGAVVAELRAVFTHVVCVDDCSTDGSGEVAAAAGAVVVRHPLNLGQGAALQTGIAFALRDDRMTSVITFDADGQHQVSDAAAMLVVLEHDGVDVVLGSRFLDERSRPPALKRLVLRAAVAYSNQTSGVRLTDAHNGLRVLNRRAAASLDIRQNRMAHASEIVTQIGRNGLTWREHPVHVLYSEYSRRKGQSVLNSINILTELLHR